MTRVYMVKAYNKYEDDEEIVGIAESLEKADLMVRDYIDKIYCYGTTRFAITWWNLNERWGEGAHERFYTYEEVICIAEELGKIKGYKDPKGPKGCVGICPNCMEATKIKWVPETDTCSCLSCGWTNAEGILEYTEMAEYEITVDKAKELLTKECMDVLKLPGLIETLHVLAHETCRLGNELEDKTLGSYSYYEGQLNGLEMALYLINRLPKAKKRPALLSHDEIEYDTEPEVLEYFYSICGHDGVEKEDHFCKNCGAYFEEDTND